jgi:hypothetical protein
MYSSAFCSVGLIQFKISQFLAGRRIVLLGTKYFGRHFSVTSKQINVNQALTSNQ